MLHFLSTSQENKKKERERKTKVNGVSQPTSAKVLFEGHTDFLLRVKGNERIPSARQIPMENGHMRCLHSEPRKYHQLQMCLTVVTQVFAASLVKEADPATFFSKGYL